MKIKKVFLVLFSFITFPVILWVSSCRHDALIPSDIPEICFEKDVLPIFTSNCSTTGCHDGTGESDLVLNNYNTISNSVEAGDPRSSELYRAIIARSGENRMPPGNPLSLESRTVIRLWIEQGAKLTLCPDTTSLVNNFKRDNYSLSGENKYATLSSILCLQNQQVTYLSNQLLFK
jgi:hypothetical protein